MDLLERFRDFLPQIYSRILVSHAVDLFQSEALCSELFLLCESTQLSRIPSNCYSCLFFKGRRMQKWGVREDLALKYLSRMVGGWCLLDMALFWDKWSTQELLSIQGGEDSKCWSATSLTGNRNEGWEAAWNECQTQKFHPAAWEEGPLPRF